MFRLLLLCFLCTPLAAWAHTGEHHGWLASIYHVLTEPDHLLWLLLAVAAGALLARHCVYQKRNKQHGA